MISKCVGKDFSRAEWVNVLENVLTIMNLVLVSKLIFRSQPLRDRIAREIVYLGAKESLLDNPFPTLGLETINVCHV